MYGPVGVDTELATKYQAIQVPIFQWLLDSNNFLSDFKIVSDDQYVGIEKEYNIDDNKFLVRIEIEDAESIQDIDTYEVWFNYHETGWYPSNEVEEAEDYPIKHGCMDSLDDLEYLIDLLNQGDYTTAITLMNN